MSRMPFARNLIDPRRTNTFLDSCAFDPKYTPEHEAAQKLRLLRAEENISILVAHSVQREVEHPNTPADVKAEAGDMIYTVETSLTADEVTRRNGILAVLAGNGVHENYAADAKHIFEAGKYMGYFVTTDNRILAKKVELERISQAVIVKPTEWLQIYEDTAAAD